jgi:DNA-binding MarR family transcriptional regulator
MFLQSQAELALGSRFKALSERLYEIANAAYHAVGIDFDAHWFPVLRYLQMKGPAGVSEIATAIGQTHSAVSQLATKLRSAGWITRKSDRNDARRSMLDLSADGERRLGAMGPIWYAIRRGAQAALQRNVGHFPDMLPKFEADIMQDSVIEDILAEYARLKAARPVILPFRAALREHFYRLNAEWLQRWFALEEIDKRVLTDPEKYIIAPGGAVLFAVIDGEAIGSCALLKEAPGVYELTKMAVETGWRGIGAGRLLLEAAIAEFERRKGTTLFLESNKKLGPALKLYESAGFVHQPAPRPGSHYARSDVYMIYTPKRRKR